MAAHSRHCLVLLFLLGFNIALNARAQEQMIQPVHNFVPVMDDLKDFVGEEFARSINNTVSQGQRHPLVFWPGYGGTELHVEVKGNKVTGCPESGSFTMVYGNPTSLQGFPEHCIYPLIQLQYDAATRKFANAPGVTTSIPDFGSPFCAPSPYNQLAAFAQTIGYTPGKDFFVACYDWRMSPDTDVGTDGPHLKRAQELVEAAYANSGGMPVYLAGHSNGPLYTLALLRAMSAEWKAKYVAGFISYAGNWMGQGSTFSEWLFSGTSMLDGRPYGPAAPAFESWPSTYLSCSAPTYYGTSEVVIRTTNATGAVPPRDYTPVDSLQLFKDAGLKQAQELGPLYLNDGTANSTPPGTHFYGFIGTGLPTLVGNTYATLAQGQLPLPNGIINSADGGDSNQENAVNTAITSWERLQGPCVHFELNREPDTPHMKLPFKPSVLKRTAEILFGVPAACGGVAIAPGEAPAPGMAMQGARAASPTTSAAGRRLLAAA